MSYAWSKWLCCDYGLVVLCPAMMRRAVANKGLLRYVQAKQDLDFVLIKEPNNKQALVCTIFSRNLSAISQYVCSDCSVVCDF